MNLPTSRLMKSWYISIVVPVLGTLCLLFAWLIYTASDFGIKQATHFTAGFSEERFSQVSVGMSDREVTEVLGKPLHVDYYVGGREIWHYTKPKGPPLLTFGSLARTVKFENETVVGVYAFIVYE
jgi:outer membrane protein assembly factor BamE (lipoprotein component of BamABCDE complex)